MQFNLLIAEDEEVMRTLLVSIVEMFFKKEYPFLELSISEAEDGQEALDIVKKERQEIILTDITMPRMNGFDFIKNVRTFDKGVPILVLSALSSDEDIDKIMQSGATNYTSKPLNGKLFTAQIKVFIDFYLRRQNKYNAKAMNLFAKNIYKRKIEFLIEKEDDLLEFWEYIIGGIFEHYRVENILNFVYDFELLLIKQGIDNSIILEENDANFYFTLLDMDKLEDEKIVEELKQKGIEEKSYRLNDFFLTLVISKRVEEEPKREVKKEKR